MKFRVRFGTWSDASEETEADSPQTAIKFVARKCAALHTGEWIEAVVTDADGARYEKIVSIDHHGRVTF